jgi:type II secretion system protein L
MQRSGGNLDEAPAARHCRLVLAADMVLTLPADLPDLSTRKLAAMLPAAAEAATLDDAEQIHVVMLGAKPGGATRLAVVKKVWLDRLLGQLRARGLHPEQAVPEFLLLPWNEGEWSMLVHEDGVVARLGEHDGAALDQGEPPAGALLARQQGTAPKHIRVYQGSALKAPDVARWSEALDLPVEYAGKWDWREATWNDRASLLTGTFTEARGRRDWSALVRPLAGGLALLGGLQLGGMALDWALQTREQASMRAEMRALAVKALPAHAAVVDPVWQVGEQLRGLRAATGGNNPDSFLSLLARAGLAWPAIGSPIPKSVNFAGRELELTLLDVEDAWLGQFENAATARGLAIVPDKGENGQILLRIRPLAAASGAQK